MVQAMVVVAMVVVARKDHMGQLRKGWSDGRSDRILQATSQGMVRWMVRSDTAALFAGIRVASDFGNQMLLCPVILSLQLSLQPLLSGYMNQLE